jgi:hypothetical protein
MKGGTNVGVEAGYSKQYLYGDRPIASKPRDSSSNSKRL